MAVSKPLTDISLAALRRIESARVESIGKTRSGAPIPAMSFGPLDAPACVVVSGMHSSELTGVLAAMKMAQTLALSREDVAVHIVPAVDLDGVRENIATVGQDPTLSSLLRLQNHRDLEGEFRGGAHPEAKALHEWMERLPRIDAFLSLHAANHVAPGGFVYLGGDESAVDETARSVTRRMDERNFPRLAADPTKVGGAAIADGIFGLPDAPNSCVSFVQAARRPSVVGITELPVGLVRVDGPVTLEELDRWKRLCAAGNEPPQVTVTPCIDQHIDLLCNFVADVCNVLHRGSVVRECT